MMNARAWVNQKQHPAPPLVGQARAAENAKLDRLMAGRARG